MVAKGWAEGGWNGDSWSEGSDPWRGKSQGKAETKHTSSIQPGMEESSLRFKALLDRFDQGAAGGVICAGGSAGEKLAAPTVQRPKKHAWRAWRAQRRW